MLKFGPTGFDPDFLSNPDNLNLTERFDAFPTDGEAGVPVMALDNPLTGLSLQLDSGFLDALFAEGGTAVGGDSAGPGDEYAAGLGTGISADGLEFSIAAAGAFDLGAPGFFATQLRQDFDFGFRAEELPIDAILSPTESGPGAGGAPADSDLIFLDFDFSGKGGVPGGNGGGGKGGGNDSDPNVLSNYVSGDEGAYNIESNFKGSWTSDLQTAFVNASELISDLIVGDIADVFYRGKIIDDIRIDAKLTEIDGEGGILGQAGPTAIRTDGYLPATAIMEFDVADAANFNTLPSGSEGTLWDDIVFHEMMHSIGFGSIWTYLDLLSGGGTDNPAFTGVNATAVYEATYGVADSGGVPVEQDGGPGTRDSHWDEEIFGNEIMTGYINNSDNYLSDMTVASLEDLAYDTVWSPGDLLIA